MGLFFLGIGQQIFAQTFRILTEEFPPYNYLHNDKISGISTEITREILKRVKHPDNIQILPWSDAYNLAQQEEDIILFSTTRTPAREKLFKWVGPLVPNNLVLFARKDAKVQIKQLADAKKVSKLGVYKDDFGELLLKQKGFTNLDSLIDNRSNVQRLANGEIDLWIANELTGKHMIQDVGLSHQLVKVFEVQKDYMYLAFSHSTPDTIVEQWQNTLDEIKADGTYAQIFSNWIMFAYSADLKPANKTIDLSEREKKWLAEHPVIKVAPDPDYAPFQYTDNNQQSLGLANDYLALIEKKLGIRFDIVSSDSWQDSLIAVKDKTADMVVVAAKTAQREEYMKFTSPYAEFPDVIISRINRPRVNSIVELHGKTIATIKGFAINDYLKKYYPNIKLNYQPDVASVLKGVSMGEFDATVLNVATASYAIEKANITNLRVDGDTGFTYKLSLASRKDWPILNQLLEKALNSFSEAEKKELHRKWVSFTYIPPEHIQKNKSVNLTDAEKLWLKKHPILTLAPDPNWAPVEFFDSDGKYSGMTADYVQLMEQKLGIRFHILHLNNWEEILQKVSTGEIDFIPAASITPNRKKNLLFTEPYLKLRSVIVVNKKENDDLTMNDLNGKVVAVVAGYANQEYMQREYPDVHLRLVNSEEEGLRQVSYGKAYAFIGSIATISYIMEKEVMANLRIAGQGGYLWNLAFATNKKKPILNRILAKGLASISKEEYHDIFNKWIVINPKSWQPSNELIIAFVVIVVFLFFLSIIIWNRMLSKQVKLRTLELKRALNNSEQLREKADKAQLQAENANLAKSKFFAAASHDLRQPIHALGLLVSALKQNFEKRNAETTYAGFNDEEKGKEKDKEIFAMIDKSLSSQKELFNSILDASKIEAGSIKANFKNFKVKPLCRELENEFAVLAKDKGLTFNLTIDLDCIVYSDELIVKRILKNLLSNAIRYSDEGEIKVSIKDVDEQIMFVVADNGPGISPQEQEKIFNEFYQIESKNNKNKGLGLGLSIVTKLAALLKTQIQLESQTGKGSLFSFTVPQGKNDSFVDRRVDRGVLNDWDLSQSKILVIDDDEDILNAMQHQLESWGSQVETFTNHIDSLEFIQQQGYQPDIMILDYRLDNNIKGTEIVSELLSQFTQLVPVIFISAEVSPEKIKEIKESGFQLLHKPVRPAALRMTLQRQLKLKKNYI